MSYEKGEKGEISGELQVTASVYSNYCYGFTRSRTLIRFILSLPCTHAYTVVSVSSVSSLYTKKIGFTGTSTFGSMAVCSCLRHREEKWTLRFDFSHFLSRAFFSQCSIFTIRVQ